MLRPNGLFTQLNEEGRGVSNPLSEEAIVQEGALAIVAGSDTTSTTLANALAYLLSDPASMKRLQRELDEAARKADLASLEEPLDFDVLAELPFLNAVM
jgi:cytochrome P450